MLNCKLIHGNKVTCHHGAVISVPLSSHSNQMLIRISQTFKSCINNFVREGKMVFNCINTTNKKEKETKAKEFIA